MFCGDWFLPVKGAGTLACGAVTGRGVGGSVQSLPTSTAQNVQSLEGTKSRRKRRPNQTPQKKESRNPRKNI